jgi:hypothetical protein
MKLIKKIFFLILKILFVLFLVAFIIPFFVPNRLSKIDYENYESYKYETSPSYYEEKNSLPESYQMMQKRIDRQIVAMNTKDPKIKLKTEVKTFDLNIKEEMYADQTYEANISIRGKKLQQTISLTNIQNSSSVFRREIHTDKLIKVNLKSSSSKDFDIELINLTNVVDFTKTDSKTIKYSITPKKEGFYKFYVQVYYVERDYEELILEKEIIVKIKLKDGIKSLLDSIANINGIIAGLLGTIVIFNSFPKKNKKEEEEIKELKEELKELKEEIE